MAAGLVTISGTTGEVLIKYLDSGSAPRQLTTGIGQLWIPDDGSAYEWTTLYGDAIAASGDVLLVEVTTTCYRIDWEEPPSVDLLTNPPLTFDAIVIDATVTSIQESYFPLSAKIVGDNINNAGLPATKAVAYKTVYPTDIGDSVEHFLIVKVQGADVPYLRIKNEASSHYIYLKGVSSTCLPAGYTEISTCQIGEELP